MRLYYSSLTNVRTIAVSDLMLKLFIQPYQWKEAFGSNPPKTGNTYYTYDSGCVFSKTIRDVKRR